MSQHNKTAPGRNSIMCIQAPPGRNEGQYILHLLPTGSEEREVLGVGSIPVAILPSCQDMKTIAINMNIVGS